MNKIDEMLNVLESENIRVIDFICATPLDKLDKILNFDDFLFMLKDKEVKFVCATKSTNYDDLEGNEEEYFEELSLRVDVLSLYIDILNRKVEDCTEIIKNTLSYSEFYLLDKIAKSKEYKEYLEDKNKMEECYTNIFLNSGYYMYFYHEEIEIPDISNYLDDLIETIKESKKYNDLLQKELEEVEEEKNKAEEEILEANKAIAQENKVKYDEMINYISNLADFKFVSKKNQAKSLAKNLRNLDINFMCGGKFFTFSSSLEELTEIIYKASLLKEC